jgi:hypothetical protein
LKLLAAFLQHSDNKPPQQRLTCDKVHVDEKAQPFTTTCEKLVMLVQDFGATLGGGGWFTNNGSAKMNLQVWSGKKVWNKVGAEGAPKRCKAALSKSLTAHNGLSDPLISEEGRRFDAGLMWQLSDHQIEDLFKASRAAAMPQCTIMTAASSPGWMRHRSSGSGWTPSRRSAKNSRKAAASGRKKPADLAAIDNPMGPVTVPPNYARLGHFEKGAPIPDMREPGMTRSTQSQPAVLACRSSASMARLSFFGWPETGLFSGGDTGPCPISRGLLGP